MEGKNPMELDVERLWRGWQRSPFHEFLQIDLTGFDREAGTAEFTIPFKEAYRRTQGKEGIHGGVLASIIDVTADFALAVAMNKMGFPTIDLRVDYLRMAGDGDLTAKARTIKKGRTIGVADVEVFDAKGRLCAVGRGAYATAAG
jgi:uncharacterized protein (TIGR00369 family)